MEDSAKHGTMLNKMPELPEVETIKNILANNVIGKTIKEVTVLRAKTIEGNVDEFIEALTKATITSITRKGKFLIFHLSNQKIFLSHLRMEGKYYYFKEKHPHTKYERVIFKFTDDTTLIYDDSRQFGIMILKSVDNYLTTPPLSELGREPFDVTNIDELYKIISKKHLPIKSVILDQHIIAGLGNIYADEVLFLSHLHPNTQANLISKMDVKNIVDNSIKVLNLAIKAGGSTIKTYHPAKGVDGNFQTKLNVYDKEGELCPICKTPMRKIFVGGRGSTYCPHCQIKKTDSYVLGVTGPIGSGKSEVLNILNSNGYTVFSADEIVHELYSRKEVVENIAHAIKDPSLINDDGSINKIKLKEYILADEKIKKRVEKIIHPLVEQYMQDCIKNCHKNEKIALEVPLLFESKIDSLCNETIYVDISSNIQEQRLQNRGANVYESLKLNQSFDALNDKKIANYLIQNNGDKNELKCSLKKIGLID